MERQFIKAADGSTFHDRVSGDPSVRAVGHKDVWTVKSKSGMFSPQKLSSQFQHSSVMTIMFRCITFALAKDFESIVRPPVAVI